MIPGRRRYDRAAGTGKYYALVDEVSGGQTRLVAPVLDLTQRTERFGPQDFTLSADGQTLTCPAGHETSTSYSAGADKEGRLFRIPAPCCAGCGLAPECRGDEVAPEAFRQVFISDYREAHMEAQAYAKTPV